MRCAIQVNRVKHDGFRSMASEIQCNLVMRNGIQALQCNGRFRSCAMSYSHYNAMGVRHFAWEKFGQGAIEPPAPRPAPASVGGRGRGAPSPIVSRTAEGSIAGDQSN